MFILRIGKTCAFLTAAVMAGSSAGPAGAAELPKSMTKILAELKLSEDILKGSEDEHKVPAAWLEAARKNLCHRKGPGGPAGRVFGLVRAVVSQGPCPSSPLTGQAQ